MWTPAAAMRGGRPIAVLRVGDQRAGRSPTVCVRSGRPTTFAARTQALGLPGASWWELVLGHAAAGAIAWILRRPRQAIVLAVDEPFWRQWRARLAFAVIVTCAGLGIVAVAVWNGSGGLAGLGVVVAVAGWLLRVRALLQCWVSVELSGGSIRVLRAHPQFDRAARELFARGAGR